MLKLRFESLIEYKDCDALLFDLTSLNFDEFRTDEFVKLMLLPCCSFSLFCLFCAASMLFFDMHDVGRGVVVVLTVENIEVGCWADTELLVTDEAVEIFIMELRTLDDRLQDTDGVCMLVDILSGCLAENELMLLKYIEKKNYKYLLNS